jgi:hypothetical protein
MFVSAIFYHSPCLYSFPIPEFLIHADIATGALAALVYWMAHGQHVSRNLHCYYFVLGMAYLLVLSSAGSSLSWMIACFMIYVLLRQFLFPVFIASLTANLGFKYFGLLSGI